MQSFYVADAVVVDMGVWVAGLRGVGDAHRVLWRCRDGRYEPLMAAALLAECEALLGRDSLWKGSRLTGPERAEI